MKSLRFRDLTVELLGIATSMFLYVPGAIAQPAAPFPLQPGEAVVSCASASNPGDYVLVALDVRDPAANAPGVDVNWPAPAFHAAGWTRAGFEGNEIFGLTVDDADAPNLYATSTSTYGGGRLGSGKVFRVDGTTAAVSVLTELPNCDDFPACPGAMGAGLGDIAWDGDHEQLFATDLYDGKIYRLKLDAAGAVDPTRTATFDPFTPFSPTGALFAPLGERPWGVAVHGGRVYFGRWSEDQRFGSANVPNTVWSVALDAAGDFTGGAQLELTLPPNQFHRTNPVADIAFSVEGRMLVAERTMSGDALPSAHRARVLEFTGGPGAWAPSGHAFVLGVFSEGANAAGGVDYVNEGDASTFVVASGDALHFKTDPPEQIYGIEILPAAGGANANSYLVDVDGEITRSDKTQIGDVEVVDAPAEPPPPPPPPPPANIDLSMVTGVEDVSGARLPRGSADDTWVFNFTTPAVLVAQPPVSWPRFRASEWISIDASAASPGNDVVAFQRCFCLASRAGNAKLTMRLWADDEATVFLNGTPIAGPGGQFRRSQPLSIFHEEAVGPVGTSLFNPGQNCVAVVVRDTAKRFVGFDAVGRLWVDHGSCTETE